MSRTTLLRHHLKASERIRAALVANEQPPLYLSPDTHQQIIADLKSKLSFHETAINVLL